MKNKDIKHIVLNRLKDFVKSYNDTNKNLSTSSMGDYFPSKTYSEPPKEYPDYYVWFNRTERRIIERYNLWNKVLQK